MPPRTDVSSSPDSPPEARPALLPSLTDLRGAVQLATDGTLFVTRVVEELHARIRSLFPSLPSVPDGPARSDAATSDAATSDAAASSSGRRTRTRATGLTGAIYRTIRAVTWGVGRGADQVLRAAAAAPSRVSPPEARPRQTPGSRDVVTSVINGVVGDHLSATENPLARPFSLRDIAGCLVAGAPDAGETVTEGPVGLASSSRTLVVFVHGLCCSDRSWAARADAPGHVTALARAVGGTPVLARYNTGQALAVNGADLSHHLESLQESLARRDRGLRRIVLVTHSMGGLVARYAMGCARRTAATWPDLVSDVIYLGTPHRGAPLERIGAWIDAQLARTFLTAPFGTLTTVRSRGIQDLRDGGAGPFGAPFSEEAASDRSLSDGSVPPRSLCVAATLSADPARGAALGDGLVPLASALDTGTPLRPKAPHSAPDRSASPVTRRVVPRLGHLALLHDPAVTSVLCTWLRAPAASHGLPSRDG